MRLHAITASSFESPPTTPIGARQVAAVATCSKFHVCRPVDQWTSGPTLPEGSLYTALKKEVIHRYCFISSLYYY